ncbi:hypothetical protein H0A66_03255 [Alcaligenaceae bacterium]|nr:hypothetical protein [Alcaligenaceae bacterium]
MAGSESLVLALSSATLVFGMEWLPLLGPRVQRQGLRLARLHKATHMVLADESAGSVGVAMLKGGKALRKRSLYSAAQNVAQLFPVGTVAVLLKIETAGYWLVAVHEGSVVARTDRIYPLSADAQPVLAELRQAYPHLQVLGQPQAPDQPSLAAIEAAGSTHSRLQTLNAWAAVLPWPVQGFVLALVLVLLTPRLVQLLWPEPEAAVPAAVADLRQVWRLAEEQAFQHHIVHGVQGTRALLNDLYTLPVRVDGWVLLQAECTGQIGGWRCLAGYERRRVNASNSGFLAAAPQHWTVEFVSMDMAQPTWTVAAPGVPLLASNLPSSAHHERDLFSALQNIKPAFNQMQIGRPAPLPVLAPLDAQGRPLPRPSGMVLYLSRLVQLVGPLRSSGLLLPHTVSMQWHKVLLALRKVEQPGLKNSGLSLSLQGVLYEVDTDSGNVGQGAAPATESIQE